MPGPIQDFIVAPEKVRVRVGLEPALNVFESLVLLHKAEFVSGLDEWVTHTAAALTPEEREAHRLVVNGLFYAIVPHTSWPSFPAYLDHLAAVDPASLRQKLLHAYARISPLDGATCLGTEDESLPLDTQAVLSSAGAYIDFLLARFGVELVDLEVERRAYALVVDPPAMQQQIVSHLRRMWVMYLAPEWERVRPMLQDAVRAFEQIDLEGKSKLEAAQWITGQELQEDKWRKAIEQAEQIVFIPSAHVGPYVMQLCDGDAMRVFFGARLPEGVPFDAPDLSRAEILVRLNALADNNRLRILRLVSEQGEQSSQDVMSSLELSQSTASRHLKQLTATGYLAERRCNGAKCYKLNPERIQATLQALSAFLLDGQGT
jgi:DNA-binding transcriptional ArsR family regulator